MMQAYSALANNGQMLAANTCLSRRKLSDSIKQRLGVNIVQSRSSEHCTRRSNNALGRIRDVRNGPDGLLYLLIDSSQGRIVRLEPL